MNTNLIPTYLSAIRPATEGLDCAPTIRVNLCSFVIIFPG